MADSAPADHFRLAWASPHIPAQDVGGAKRRSSATGTCVETESAVFDLSCNACGADAGDDCTWLCPAGWPLAVHRVSTALDQQVLPLLHRGWSASHTGKQRLLRQYQRLLLSQCKHKHWGATMAHLSRLVLGSRSTQVLSAPFAVVGARDPSSSGVFVIWLQSALVVAC